MEPLPITKHQIGDRLFRARAAVGKTVREVAQEAGIDHSTIVRYENGKMLPTPEVLATLARIYGLTPAALYAQHETLMPLIAMLDRAGPGAAALQPAIQQMLEMIRGDQPG